MLEPSLATEVGRAHLAAWPRREGRSTKLGGRKFFIAGLDAQLSPLTPLTASRIAGACVYH